MYRGIETLKATGDQVQYGGPHLCAGWHFPTADGKAHFAPVPLPNNEIPAGLFAVSTRRGKQFNTMVHEKTDAITGAGRNSVFMNAADAAALGLREGDPVRVFNKRGELRARVFMAPVKQRNLQVHWPEGNVLLDHDRRSKIADVPDYNAFVRVEPAQVTQSAAD